MLNVVVRLHVVCVSYIGVLTLLSVSSVQVVVMSLDITTGERNKTNVLTYVAGLNASTLIGHSVAVPADSVVVATVCHLCCMGGCSAALYRNV